MKDFKYLYQLSCILEHLDTQANQCYAEGDTMGQQAAEILIGYVKDLMRREEDQLTEGEV